MVNNKRWVIEARVNGRLDFHAPQPERFFGNDAITGITEDAMAKTVWRHAPDAVLEGANIALWAACLDHRFIAREKTW